MQRKTVLVGVLKSERDLEILLRERWYRIPLAHLPKRRFTHIAFYQPARVGSVSLFGQSSKRIEYYARIAKREVSTRLELLPAEDSHARAHDAYLKCSFQRIQKLSRPIRNLIPRRISFGFTDLKTLRSAGDILELYHVAPTEQIIERELKQLRVPATAQFCLTVPVRGHRASVRYRLDLAVFCKEGPIAIECDNRKAHASKVQRRKDAHKDRALRRLGWHVIRLAEADILGGREACIQRIQSTISSLGGLAS